MRRSFQPQWFQKWPWLHYDEVGDSAFCSICVQAARSESLTSVKFAEPSFITRGFSNWKDASGERGAFNRHESSICHKTAFEAVVTLPKTTKDVGELLSVQHAEEKAVNRKNLLVIAENIKFLARQGLALRGDGSDNDSNFHQLLLLREKENPTVQRLFSKKTDKYTSPQIQNELLQIMALTLLRDIANSIRNSPFYCIMADEVTDSSNREQVVLCFRWIDKDLQAHEDFVGLHVVEKINSDTLVKVIKDVLLRFNLPINQCRGQCYDGAANMAGSRNGVATQISRMEERAVFTHCYGHALNLAVADVLKECSSVRDVLDTVGEISRLLKFSPKRDSQFEKLKDSISPETSGFRTLCPTRWTVRATSLLSVMENFEVFQEFWDTALEDTSDSETRSRLNGVKMQMQQFHFLFGISLGECILRHTDNLSRSLQSPSMSAAECQHLAEKTCSTLQRMRTKESFDMFWKNLLKRRSDLDIGEPKLPRPRKAPRRFEVGTGEGYHPQTVEEHYLQLYFLVLDSTMACIRQRFDQAGYQTYKRLETLLLSAADGKNYEEELNFVTKFYGSDFEKSTLDAQLQLLHSMREHCGSNQCLQNVISHLQSLSLGLRSSLKQVFTLASLIVVMPATNAVSERSASALRRVKTYLRSTMSEARLNNLLVMHVHKDKTDNLNLVNCLNDFVSRNPHRLAQFGNFTLE